MNVTTIGLDIAKQVFHAVCCNEKGKLIKKKVLKRPGVLTFFSNMPKCVVAIEACATAHYWAREIERYGHTVKPIPPQRVKAFLVGNGSAYRKGRDVAASLGLVPKQHSSGGKDVLLGISKRGNRYLRCLLVQGAKAVVSRAKKKDDKHSCWINNLVKTRGHNRACVAYANKMARMAWAITVNETEYSAA